MIFDPATKRMVSEKGDTTVEEQTASAMNKLMDSLKWFAEHGIKVAVTATRKGHVIKLSK